MVASHDTCSTVCGLMRASPGPLVARMVALWWRIVFWLTGGDVGAVGGLAWCLESVERNGDAHGCWCAAADG